MVENTQNVQDLFKLVSMLMSRLEKNDGDILRLSNENKSMRKEVEEVLRKIRQLEDQHRESSATPSSSSSSDLIHSPSMSPALETMEVDTVSNLDEAMDLDIGAQGGQFEEPGIDDRNFFVADVAVAEAVTDKPIETVIVDATPAAVAIVDANVAPIQNPANTGDISVVNATNDGAIQHFNFDHVERDAIREKLKKMKPTDSDFAEIFSQYVSVFQNESVKEDIQLPKTKEELHQAIRSKRPALVDDSRITDVKTMKVTFKTLGRIGKGIKYELKVINSRTQQSTDMPLVDLCKKFLDGRADGLNLLSFVMKNVVKRLSRKFKPPKYILESSWVDRTMRALNAELANIRKQMAQDGKTKELQDREKELVQMKENLPELEKFLLLSGKTSFTGVHVDMAGTAVFYHVITGKKVFFLARPTEENLRKYVENECSEVEEEWLVSKLFDEFQVLEINPGQTAFIPSGWIHFVWTPEDSIVFGGNYLADDGTDLQFKFAELERVLVQEKLLDSSTIFTNFGETAFAYAELVLPKELESKATSLEVGGQYLSGLRGLAQREKVNASEQTKRLAVISKLEQALTLCANDLHIDAAQFLASCKVKDYDFEIITGTSEKRKHPLSETNQIRKRKNAVGEPQAKKPRNPSTIAPIDAGVLPATLFPNHLLTQSSSQASSVGTASSLHQISSSSAPRVPKARRATRVPKVPRVPRAPRTARAPTATRVPTASRTARAPMVPRAPRTQRTPRTPAASRTQRVLRSQQSHPPTSTPSTTTNSDRVLRKRTVIKYTY